MKSRQMFACVLLALISQSYTISNIPDRGGPSVKGTCYNHEYSSKAGICCDKCHPGFKLKTECPEPNKRSECVQCENGTYLETFNSNSNCFRCRKCNKDHSIEESPCTHTRNTKCTCETGYYFWELDGTWSCLPCRKCGPDQVVVEKCGKEQNTKCRCRDNYYPAKGNACKLCVECREGCKHLCETSTPRNPVLIQTFNPTSPPDLALKILLPVCACIMVLALGVFMIYEAIRLWKKKRRASPSQKSSPASDDQTIIITVGADKEDNESIPLTKEQCEKLPDCVPREIKIHEFFYFVLDEVPIGRFKELVRRLGVSEQNIDRAEQDHRNSKDAHYQMLKVWSDSSSGGGSNVLPCYRIQMFVDTLKDMYLVSCADNIENRFLSQDISASH